MPAEQNISALFSRIAKKYDAINHIISFGVDIYWRKKAASVINAGNGEIIADLCSGTGELAFAIAKLDPQAAAITCYDISEKMLENARLKNETLKKENNVWPRFEFVVCDCAHLPCQDNSFDIATCAFGLRNMSDPAKAATEMYRILRPGGRVCIVEFTLPKAKLLRRMYLLYFRSVLPALAGAIGGDRSAYEYFVDSVCRWDRDVDAAEMLAGAGFRKVQVIKLNFGVAAIYVGRKNEEI
jgi:demethylmenaquinone methyltransferase/2-methoxy-6-polyprenyl-1,4-benzoquinol methylase